MHKTASIKPTKVTKEDIELADEISLVNAIKEAVNTFGQALHEEFGTMEEVSSSGNAVAAYKQILSSYEFLSNSLNDLGANLLVGLGEIDPEDAKELSDPTVAEIAGTMDAALTESPEPTVEIQEN